MREALKAHGGSEVKTMGDGFMASFSSATKALECAITMQRAFAERNESAEEPILVRVGLNAGEPIAEDDPDGRSDLFGTAVNMAARIASKADGGEILARTSSGSWWRARAFCSRTAVRRSCGGSRTRCGSMSSGGSRRTQVSPRPAPRRAR